MIIRLKVILILLAGILLFSQCKKEDEDWIFCQGCELSSWVGIYEGSGLYYSDTDGKMVEGVPTIVTIENTSGTILKTTVIAEDYFTTTFTVNKINNEYFIEVLGSNSSLSLTLSIKGNEYKLSGTAKKYHDGVFIDHSISFETYKLPEN